MNLGSRTFRYQEANNQRPSQESIESISAEEVRASLAELPFCDCSESDDLEEIDEQGGSVYARDNEGTTKNLKCINEVFPLQATLRKQFTESWGGKIKIYCWKFIFQQ